MLALLRFTICRKSDTGVHTQARTYFSSSWVYKYISTILVGGSGDIVKWRPFASIKYNFPLKFILYSYNRYFSMALSTDVCSVTHLFILCFFRSSSLFCEVLAFSSSLIIFIAFTPMFNIFRSNAPTHTRLVVCETSYFKTNRSSTVPTPMPTPMIKMTEKRFVQYLCSLSLTF